MRTAVLLLALSCGLLAGPAAAQEPAPLRATPVTDSLLVRILNDGVVQEIERPRGPPTYLHPRLYRVREEGGCVEDTHMVCGYWYYLAVSEDGEAPRQAVFDLGWIGEVVGAELLAGRGPDRPRLRLTLANYPSHVFRYQRNLVLREAVYLVDLGVDELKIVKER